MHRHRFLSRGFGALAIATALALVAPSAAGAASTVSAPDRAVAGSGLAYVATQQLADGGFEVAKFPGFETPEAVLAFAANAQSDPNHWSAREARLAVARYATPTGRTGLDELDRLADEQGDKAISSGLAAKLITLVAAPLCESATAFDPMHNGPTNLVTRMESGARDDGSYDGVFSFALYAALAHASLGTLTHPKTVEYIQAAQESDGSYNYAGDPNPAPASKFDDIDTTALAVEALLATGVARDHPSVARAVAFLVSKQGADGSWAFGDPNATANAALALEAAGVDPSTRTPSAYDFLRSQQGADGRIASPNDSFGVNTYATTQSVRALLRRTLPVSVATQDCPNQGYYAFAEDGGVFALGGARFRGSMGGTPLNSPMVGGATTSAARGYDLFAADGGVFAFGDAPFAGSMGDKHLNSAIVGGAITRSGRGYVLFAGDGGVFSFGDAPFAGSMGDKVLNSPIVGGAITPSGRGYVLFAADGGVFSFGDAPFLGSMGSTPLTKAIVGGASTPTGRGYVLTGADGGLFTFGDARYLGSTGGRLLSAPMVGVAMSPTGHGYMVVAKDASAFGFGDAPEARSTGVGRLNSAIVAAAIA